MRGNSLALAFMLCAQLLLVATRSQAENADVAKTNASTETVADSCIKNGPNASIHAALKRPLDVDFVETPLGDVIEFLRQKTKIEIQPSTRALANAGLSTDMPVSCNIKGVSLGASLRIILRDLDLTYVIRDEVLLITTPDECEAALETRVLPVDDLVSYRDQRSVPTAGFDHLIDLISVIISPQSWGDVGGPGTIDVFRGSLVVSQTADVQTELCELLESLRKFPLLRQYQEDAPMPKPISLADVHDPAKARLEKKFAEETQFEFIETPLADVAAFISDKHEIPVLVDTHALGNAGLSGETPVSKKVKGVTLRSALRLLLRDLDLTYVIRDEVVWITVPESVEQHVVNVLFPVADLIVSRDDAGAVLIPVPDLIVDRDDVNVVDEQFENLIHVITSTVQPSTWDEVGGPGSLTIFAPRGLLVVSNTPDVQKEVSELLKKLRAAHKQSATLSKPEDGAHVLRGYSLIESKPNSPPINYDDLVEIIQQLVTPDEWNDEVGAPLIRYVGQRLIVHHRRNAQQQIERMLRETGFLFEGTGFGTPASHPNDGVFGDFAD